MGKNSTFDVAIIGGGLAGISAAIELLDHGLKIVIIDRDSEQNFGGLAMTSVGFFSDIKSIQMMGAMAKVKYPPSPIIRNNDFNFCCGFIIYLMILSKDVLTSGRIQNTISTK